MTEKYKKLLKKSKSLGFSNITEAIENEEFLEYREKKYVNKYELILMIAEEMGFNTVSEAMKSLEFKNQIKKIKNKKYDPTTPSEID